ncbi:hypothetical protein [Pelagibius marinus]|uniref:hypothetical protein n=1 Tax=Pelagibius marinus TaxID=2762760 RepID=UPI0018724D1D|nr:hypothetical protein [Pelagibius marinus]
MPRRSRLKRKGNFRYFPAKAPQDVREIIGKSEIRTLPRILANQKLHIAGPS